MSIGKDKFLHMGVCFLSTIIVFCVSYFIFGKWPSLVCGGLFSLGLGIGKEYGDSKAKGNKWDWFDIIADLIGIILALIIGLIVGR